MRKLNFFLLFISISSLIICIFLSKSLLKKNPALVLSERSLTDTALSLFSEDLQKLTASQIALQQQEINSRLLKLAAQDAQVRAKIEAIPFWQRLGHQTAAGTLLVIGSTLLSATITGSLVFFRRRQLVIQRIGSSELTMHYSQTRQPGVALALAGLVQAEQARAVFPEEAAKMALQFSEALTGQMRALAGRKGWTQPIDITPHHEARPVLPAPVPTFRDLLSRGEIRKGGNIIFGVNDSGDIRSGTWVDLFSSAIGGQSGQGKTATLRSLIAQSLLTKQVAQVWVVDYHYPHPKSLLSTMGEVKNLPQIKYVENPFDIPELLQEVDTTIDRRLRMQEPSEPVKILVCDEVLILCEKIPMMTQIIRRLGTEARKCGVYGLFSSQVWKAESVGGSEVRDCLTSRLCHKMQPKQANMLLQDKEQSQVVKRLETGRALFSPVSGDPEVLSIPYCEPSDMIAVYQMLKPSVGTAQNIQNIAPVASGREKIQNTSSDMDSLNVDEQESTVDLTDSTDNSGVEYRVDEIAENIDFLQKIRRFQASQQPPLSLGELSRRSGIDKGQLSKVLNGKESLTPNIRKKLETLLTTEKI